MRRLALTISLLIFTIGSILGQTGVVTTAAAVKVIKDDLTDLVDESLDRADFTIAKAAVEMLGIIDAWEAANSNLLDDAFDGIENTSRNLFARASSLIEQANEKGADLIKTAEEISITAAQIAESLPFAEKRTYILNYSPKVISPLETDRLLVKLTGVNLDKADALITLPDNSSATARPVGPKEINFWVPISSVSATDSKSKLHEVTIEHQTRDGSYLWIWPRYKRVKRTIFLSTLPNEFASYSVSGTRSFKKEERKMHTTNCGRFEGKNKEIEKMARPPSGYKWDLRKGTSARNDFRVVTTGGGEKGRCQFINWNGSGENGIIANARVDQIRQVRGFPPEVRWKDGYIHCGINGPVYRFLDASEPMKKQSGKLQWNKDHSIDLEEDVSSFELKIKLPNGEEKIVTNNFEHNLFSVVKEGIKLIIRPKIPKDLGK